MFAGIGGFRAGLTRAGSFQCVGHCEIDKYAEASYRAIHDIREEERYYPSSKTRGGRVSKMAHDAASVQGIVERGGRIRRLMPRECLWLQGFDEEQIDKILAITSDAQAYKQAGNSVTVNVIEAIGRRLRAVDEELRKEAAA